MQAGLAPDAAIHNSLLRVAFANGADIAKIKDSINAMESMGVRPDEKSYTVLLRAHSWQGDARGAAALLSRLQDSGGLLSACRSTDL